MPTTFGDVMAATTIAYICTDDGARMAEASKSDEARRLVDRMHRLGRWHKRPDLRQACSLAGNSGRMR